jgi:hypothetical protein
MGVAMPVTILRNATVVMQFRACEGLHRHCIASGDSPHSTGPAAQLAVPTIASEQLVLSYNMASIGTMQS